MKKPHTNSLQDQLLKAGLTNTAKVKQVKAEKRKKDKQQRNNPSEVADEVKSSVEQARQQQVERDRELNQQRKQAEDLKALAAQIKQLVQLNRIGQDVDGMAYQFSHNNVVKKVYVMDKVREALTAGRAAIVFIDDVYEIVPAEIARKIQDRDADYVIVLNDSSQETVKEDDPYAAYQIPDDLMW